MVFRHFNAELLHICLRAFSVSGGLTTRCHDSMKERLNSRISRPEIGVKASKVEAINSADLSHLLTAELG